MKDEINGMTTLERCGSTIEPLIDLSKPENKNVKRAMKAEDWACIISSVIIYLVIAAVIGGCIYACIIVPPLWWGFVITIFIISLIMVPAGEDTGGPI